MKFYPAFSVIIVLAISVLSCSLPGNSSKQSELSIVKVNNEYSLGVPAYMTKATNLNDDASLQYQNIFKETYVIVIDEGKQEFIDAYVEAGSYDSTISVLANYANTQIQLSSANMEKVTGRKNVEYLKINGLEAATAEIDATVAGVATPISYFFTYVEGPDNLYMIMAWTLKDKKETYRKDFEEMAKSFKIERPGPVAVK